MSMDDALPWLERPLQQALREARSHALLIHGPRGVGQFELAMAVAAAWLCETHRGAAPACGACAGCRMLAARTHPDLQLLLPEALQVELGWTGADEAADGEGGKRKPSKDIRIEAVRTAIGFTQQTSARGGPKVVVMFPAERMNAADWYWLGITPEASRSYRPNWKSGFYHLALEAKVPLCLVYIDYPNKTLGMVDHLYLSGDQQADMAAIRAVYEGHHGLYPENQAPIVLQERRTEERQ